MATFKLSIASPKEGKTYQTEIKDDEAKPFIGLNIGETVKGELIGLTGAELQVTGGSDKSGFPMRRGIKDPRKRLSLLGGVGLRKKRDNQTRSRKTVCGHKISERIAQINLKVTKEGSKKVADHFAAPAEPSGEEAAN